MIVNIAEENGFAVFRPRGRLNERMQDYLRAIDGAKYNRDKNANYASVDKVPSILKRLREANFDAALTKELAMRLREHTAQMWLDLQSSRERLQKIDETLAKHNMKLYPFQRAGVEWLATRTCALLADDMGLGKTIQALCALPANPPVIIVCPSSVKGVWKREFKKVRPHLKPTVLEGRGNFRWPEAGEVIIVNPDILPDAHKTEEKLVKDKKTGEKKKKQVKACDNFCEGCLPFLAECTPGTVVIIDEAHMFMNSKAQRTIKLRAMGNFVREKTGRTWALTATPLLGKPPELWAVCQVAGVAQEAFGNWKNFVKIFDGKAGMWGGYDWGTPQAEAGERFRRVSLRRMKKDVLPELPAKTWNHITVDVDNATLKKCDAILKKYGGIEKIMKLIETGSFDFETLASTRHALAVGKMPALLEMIGAYEEQEEPLVVFSAHRAVVEELGKRPGWATILGGDGGAEDRTNIEEAFQRGELKGIAATIAAGGVGITLTRASNMIFTDLDWTPALNAQAEDRICRIGQTRGCVYTILQANHPLDERIVELLSQKQRLISATVDASSVIDTPIQADLTELDYEAMIRAAEEEIAHAEKPKEEPPKPSKYRAPETPLEKWVCDGIRTLAGLDPDRAAERNDVGFNGTDGGFGHSLAKCLETNGGLSDAQYKAAIKMLAKYHRQIGEKPE